MAERFERIEFTKEMKKDYTILMPMMLPIHFSFLNNILKNNGYNSVLLTNDGPSVVETGLKYVQNDTCYPALLVIGQFIDALNSGKYNLDKTALIITQTGGGCRASNYIHLLRKALKKAGYGNIPVISLNPFGIEKNSGFTLSVSMLREFLAAVIYGDLLMLLKNQTEPYEINKGDAQKGVQHFISEISDIFDRKKGYTVKEMSYYMDEICRYFSSIPIKKSEKVKVGIVGEIYVKYSSLANNNLEQFLINEENCEINVPGLMGFIFYCADNVLTDKALYGTRTFVSAADKMLINYMLKIESILIDTIKKYPSFNPPLPFYKTKELVKDIIGYGAKMGEGWLLTAEMVELIHHGFSNIICTQPFGCLPNHIVGKGMIKKLRNIFPSSNIVAIDYDPGATKVNQENRIKLMLSIARENIQEMNNND